MTTIVLCGGSGTRLWPLSKISMPKQFAKILPGGTLFEQTISRNSPGNFIIASNEAQSLLAKSQLKNLGVNEYQLLIEPVGRNTAPAIALAAFLCKPEEVLLVVPSDHLIKGLAEYKKVITKGTELARQKRLVTFCIQPHYPETGFGYIELEGDRVKSFKEKPDLDTAKHYLASGKYFWNSGMFCFTAETFLAELKTHSPDVYYAAKKAFNNSASLTLFKPSLEDMMTIPSISIDYALMEKSKLVSCVACPESLGWSDLGSYDALFDELSKSSVPQEYNGDRASAVQKESPKNIENQPYYGDRASAGNSLAPCIDENGNISIAQTQPIIAKGNQNLVFSKNRRVVIAGANDLIVVETESEVLICKRGNSQTVKDAVDKLKLEDPDAL